MHILGIKIDSLTQQQALQRIEAFINSKKPHYIVTANAEIVYQASNDAKMAQVINQAHLVTADGSGVIWASKYINQPLPQRVTGIGLVQDICQQSAKKGWKIYILGAAPGIAQQAVENINRQYPGCHIIGYHHGYFKENEQQNIIKEIQSLSPDVLLVAMGAPRQEYWITTHMQQLNVPVSIGIGGSLDVISGNLKRAPLWMQKMSLEWAYRLIKQPSRIKRATALPKFVIKVITQGKKA